MKAIRDDQPIGGMRLEPGEWLVALARVIGRVAAREAHGGTRLALEGLFIEARKAAREDHSRYLEAGVPDERSREEMLDQMGL